MPTIVTPNVCRFYVKGYTNMPIAVVFDATLEKINTTREFLASTHDDRDIRVVIEQELKF